MMKLNISMLLNALNLQTELRRALLHYDIKKRYEWFLKEYSEINGKISDRYIASFLNMTPESLSRVKKGAARRERVDANREKQMKKKQDKAVYDRIAVGERLRTRREMLGWSRAKVAEQIGIVDKYYADIERGGYCGMSIETLIGLSRLYGMNIDD